MSIRSISGRAAVALVSIMTLSGCAGMGNIGSVLGDVLGGSGAQQGQTGQVSGTVLGVDTRAQAIGVQQANGQSINLLFDNNTQVVYENRNYPPTALERGDRITARVQSVSQGYYTDLVRVDQSVSGSSSGASGTVQQIEGTVQQVNLTEGTFTMSIQGSGFVTVSLPYNATRNEITRFQNLRRGDRVRFYGVFLNDSRIELRQFI